MVFLPKLLPLPQVVMSTTIGAKAFNGSALLTFSNVEQQKTSLKPLLKHFVGQQILQIG
jgi:aerobic-type carbon monoxide dehydrogenase small subunit (CoxS/CutS family)